MLLLLKQSQGDKMQPFHQPPTAEGQESAGRRADRDKSSAMRLAILGATRAAVTSTGAAAAALADLTGSSKRCLWSCGDTCSVAVGNTNRSMEAVWSESWLVKAMQETASDIRAVRASLAALTVKTAGGVR